MTPEQIETLERLEREATETWGPTWVAKKGPDPDGRDEPWLSTPEHDDGYGGVSASIVGLDMSTENVALAAAMRSALPSLLSSARALAALRAEVEALRTAAGKHARWQFDRMFGAVEGRDVYDSAGFVRALEALLLPGGDDAKEPSNA